MATELNDMKIKMPIKQAPTKSIRDGGLMTDSGIATFPLGDCPTTKAFTGVKGLIHGVAKIDPENVPWMGRK
jgi:hypothetical protein